MKTYMDIIRELREDHDLKQSEIAGMLGTTQQQYSNYETGESELPIRALAVLADYYKVSADYIMGRTACADGIDGLAHSIADGISAGALITEVLSLSKEGRDAVLEYIALRKLKENCSCQQKRRPAR